MKNYGTGGFGPGDRVHVRKHGPSDYTGLNGTVDKVIPEDAWPIKVKFDNGRTFSFAACELDLTAKHIWVPEVGNRVRIRKGHLLAGTLGTVTAFHEGIRWPVLVKLDDDKHKGLISSWELQELEPADEHLDFEATLRGIMKGIAKAGFSMTGLEAISRQSLNVAEESGEFIGAVRRWSGQARRPGTFQDVEDEWADVIITAHIAALMLGINREKALARKGKEVLERPFRAEPVSETSPPTGIITKEQFELADARSQSSMDWRSTIGS